MMKHMQDRGTSLAQSVAAAMFGLDFFVQSFHSMKCTRVLCQKFKFFIEFSKVGVAEVL